MDDLGGLDQLSLELLAQRRAEQHLTACEEALYDDAECCEGVDGPSVGPFCGCTTCVVREVLHAAWPVLLELARREVDIFDGASRKL